MNQKNGTHKNFCALKMSNICQQNVSKKSVTMKFSLSIVQFNNIVFTHSTVEEFSHFRSANKVTGKDVYRPFQNVRETRTNYSSLKIPFVESKNKCRRHQVTTLLSFLSIRKNVLYSNTISNVAIFQKTVGRGIGDKSSGCKQKVRKPEF